MRSKGYNQEIARASGDRDRSEFRKLLPAGGCIDFGSLRPAVARIDETDVCSLDCAKTMASMRTDTGSGGVIQVLRHRLSLLKVATGFELAKQFSNKKLQKTIVQDGEIRTSV